MLKQFCVFVLLVDIRQIGDVVSVGGTFRRQLSDLSEVDGHLDEKASTVLDDNRQLVEAFLALEVGGILN